MLFNSFEFLFVFLPVCLGGCFLLNRWAGRRDALVWLSVMAVVFYGVWNARDIAFLAVSILINFFLALAILRASRGPDRLARQYDVARADFWGAVDDNRLFADTDHLNLRGARKIAPRIVDACFGNEHSTAADQ